MGTHFPDGNTKAHRWGKALPLTGCSPSLSLGPAFIGSSLQCWEMGALATRPALFWHQGHTWARASASEARGPPLFPSVHSGPT